MVKRIRGITFSTRVSAQFENNMIHAARGIFNRLLPDVHIFTDHRAGPQAGKYVFYFYFELYRAIVFCSCNLEVPLDGQYFSHLCCYF